MAPSYRFTNAKFVRRVRRVMTVTPEQFAEIKDGQNQFPEDSTNKIDCLKFVPENGDKFPIAMAFKKEYEPAKRCFKRPRYTVSQCKNGDWRKCV